MHLYLVVLMLLNIVDFGLFHIGAVKPAFFMMGLFSILLIRPDIMPQAMVFIYGIILDSLAGTPFGFYPIMGLTLWLLIMSGRRYLFGQSWHVVWSGFILCYALLMLLEIFIFNVLGDTPIDARHSAGGLLLTILTFPLCFLPFLWIDRWAKQKEA